MTPEAKAVLEYQIGAVLERFGTVDFGEVGLLRRGVWEMELGTPLLIRWNLTSAEAHALVRRLQTAAIIQLIEETELVRAAD